MAASPVTAGQAIRGVHQHVVDLNAARVANIIAVTIMAATVTLTLARRFFQSRDSNDDVVSLQQHLYKHLCLRGDLCLYESVSHSRENYFAYSIQF